jgi:carbamoyl-phosphate synthase large subunit
MLGESLASLDFTEEVVPAYVSVKEAVFPFNKFREFDPILGPEMRSTGEVMGISDSFGTAYAKSQLAAGNGLPSHGTIMVTVNDSDKPNVVPIMRRFHEMGFDIAATQGTAAALREAGIPVTQLMKVYEGRPNAIDKLIDGTVQLLINTPLGKHAQQDDYIIREAAISHQVPYTTTLSAANAACDAAHALRTKAPEVRSLQDWHAMAAAL